MLELFMIIPLVSALRNDRLSIIVWQIVGVACFLYSAVPYLGISVMSWAWYAGHARGVEVTIIDILMVAIAISQRSQVGSSHPPFRIAMWLYFCVVTLRVAFAQVPIAALFYAWQLLRMYLVFVVVARASADERVVIALLKGFAIGIL